MILYDKNQTLQPPEGYQLVDVRAQGAFLRVAYWKVAEREISDVVVYLNDMGREVARTVSTQQETVSAPEGFAPVARRFRIRNGFLIALQGIQEMFR